MKAKLIVEGREFPIEIQYPELEKLLKPKKKTGYERVELGEVYWSLDPYGGPCECIEDEQNLYIDERYECVNYYSDKDLAKNNSRADKLMRQLRRFAVEHREELDWSSEHAVKYHIYYNHRTNLLCIDGNCARQLHGVIYFDTEEAINLAIETFHDELIWYFTEYKDSL